MSKLKDFMESLIIAWELTKNEELDTLTSISQSIGKIDDNNYRITKIYVSKSGNYKIASINVDTKEKLIEFTIGEDIEVTTNLKKYLNKIFQGRLMIDFNYVGVFGTPSLMIKGNFNAIAELFVNYENILDKFLEAHK